MFLSVFDVFKIGIGPSSSHTMGPMSAAKRFLDEIRTGQWPRPTGAKVAALRVSLHGSLAFTGAIASVHTALYFSAATFTTIGGGVVQTEEPWQFFASLEGLSGIIMVGWSISFLVAVTNRLGMWTQKSSKN